MSVQLDNRRRKRGPSGDIPGQRMFLPRVVKRRRPEVILDMTAVNNDNVTQEDIVDAEDMAEMFLQAVANPSSNSTAIPLSSSNDSTSQASLLPTDSNDPNDNGDSNNDNNNSNNNDNNNDPPPPPPPDTTTALPTETPKSQIPCRYHTLPGGYFPAARAIC